LIWPEYQQIGATFMLNLQTDTLFVAKIASMHVYLKAFISLDAKVT
jgi:hypothetical protein